MKLPFAVYTAREGYQWISGLDAGLARLEQFRRSIGKLPEFDFGDPLSCGAVNFGDTVVAYRFLKEEKGDFRGRDSLYLALTYFDKSVAGSINFDELLSNELFLIPLREPPSELSYDGGFAVDSGFALDGVVGRIGLDSVGILYEKIDGGRLKVIQLEGDQNCTVKYLPPVVEVEPDGRSEVISEDAAIPENRSCHTGRESYRVLIVLSTLLFVVFLFGCYVLWMRLMSDGEGGTQNMEINKPVTSLTKDGGLDNE